MISTSYAVSTKDMVSKKDEKKGCIVFLIGSIFCGFPFIFIEYAETLIIIGGVLGGIITTIIWTNLSGADHKSTIKTTLKSDGSTLLVFNERLPDIEKKGLCFIFRVNITDIQRCESAATIEVFGKNIILGSYTALEIKPLLFGHYEQLARHKNECVSSKAIYLRASDDLLLISEASYTNSLLVSIMGQINHFLDDARALRASSPSGAPDLGGPASSTGFDI